MTGNINMCSSMSGKADGLDHVLQPEMIRLGFGKSDRRKHGRVVTSRKTSGAILRVCAEHTTGPSIGIT